MSAEAYYIHLQPKNEVKTSEGKVTPAKVYCLAMQVKAAWSQEGTPWSGM